MKRLIASLIASATGVGVTLAGLAVDAWLHAQDETLAARGGVFTLTNPGHALLAAGVALVCGGIFVALHAAWAMAKPRGLLGRPATRHLSLAASALASVAAIGFALSVSAEGHDHGVVASAEHVHDATHAHAAAAMLAIAPALVSSTPAAAEEPAQPHEHSDSATPSDETIASMLAGAAMPATGAHAHTDAMPASNAMPEGDVAPAMTADHAHDRPQATADELACLSDLMARAKEATARFAEIDVAFAEGYVQNPGDPSSTHYPNRAYTLDGVVMDLARPETLVYKTLPDGGRLLLGVMFKAAKGQPGPTPCGAATHWHTHSVCIDPATRMTLADTDGACPGGTVARESGEMMHLWFLGRRAGTTS